MRLRMGYVIGAVVATIAIGQAGVSVHAQGLLGRIPTVSETVSGMRGLRDTALGANDDSMTRMARRYRDYRDARINRDGENPQRERVDPLKRIADPANLAEGKPPVIQAAAKIKTDQDLKDQKLKAVKYLATVCCNCDNYSKDVKDGLLSAMEDCSAEVRYEAVVAFCQCAGSVCSSCSGTCCDEDIVKKLDEMANKYDDNGCPIEKSPRVRAAAALALDRCNMKLQTGNDQPTPAPGPVEASRETPGLFPMDPPAGASGTVERPVRQTSLESPVRNQSTHSALHTRIENLRPRDFWETN